MALILALNKNKIEAGCDEAGRGCLAGPVVAAAVILPKQFKNSELNDSKKLSEKKREALEYIIQNEAIAWAIGIVSVSEIDRINILNASFLAMHRAIDQLDVKPQHLLIDGNRFNDYANIPHDCIIQGDGKYMAIAAASILAKTFRDKYMLDIHNDFPIYNWASNKGYPTRQHRLILREHGASIHHRKTFGMSPDQLRLDF